VELKKHEPLKLVLLNRILIHQIREKIYLFIACAFEQDLDSPYEKKKIYLFIERVSMGMLR